MMDRWGPKHVELTYVMNKLTQKNSVYLFGLHIYYKMIHDLYNIKLRLVYYQELVWNILIVTWNSGDCELHAIIHYKWYNEEVWYNELRITRYPNLSLRNIGVFLSLSHHVYAFQCVIRNTPIRWPKVLLWMCIIMCY